MAKIILEFDSEQGEQGDALLAIRSRAWKRTIEEFERELHNAVEYAPPGETLVAPSMTIKRIRERLYEMLGEERLVLYEDEA
jgi:hypothetical protein